MADFSAAHAIPTSNQVGSGQTIEKFLKKHLARIPHYGMIPLPRKTGDASLSS
jgi:hypothetical protein